LTLYHGTNSLIGTIDLSLCRNRTDFGKGFYLTDKIGTAQLWAIRKSELSSGIATIIQYEIDESLFSIYGKRFAIYPESEWLDFICSNRRIVTQTSLQNEPRHDYAWVSGPIADDRIVDIVDEYLNEEISAQEALLRSNVLPATYQLSLHSQTAISFVNEDSAMYRQLKNGRWSQRWLKRKQPMQ